VNIPVLRDWSASCMHMQTCFCFVCIYLTCQHHAYKIHVQNLDKCGHVLYRSHSAYTPIISGWSHTTRAPSRRTPQGAPPSLAAGATLHVRSLGALPCVPPSGSSRAAFAVRALPLQFERCPARPLHFESYCAVRALPGPGRCS